MRAIPVLFVLSVSLLSVGCGATTSSRNIRTAGVVALIDVTSERGDEAVVNAELVVGGAGSNTSLVLEGGDSLTAARGSDKKAMRAVGGEEYEARFGSGGREFVVSFDREGDDDAPKTHGTLPKAFEITSDFGSDPISREKDAITITWSPSGEADSTIVELNGDCTHWYKEEVSGDSGSYTIPAGELKAWKSKKDKACNVDVSVTRIRLGQGDPALGAETRMTLRRVRKTRLISGP